nr:ABZJ_00895 family protein [uncultured Rhodoferax sp.]
MRTSLGRYWVIFALIYAGVMLLVNVVTHGFNIDLGSGANVAMLFAAGYGSAIKFVNDNKRAPDAVEKRKLIWGSFSISIAISIVAMFVLSMILGEESWREFIQFLHEVPVIVWTITIPVITLLYYFLLSFMYGWGARKYAEKATAKNAI